jgi:hypothetical protein
MTLWLAGLVFGIAGLVALRVGYRRWRARRIALRRIVEQPNSFYASALVRSQVDRARWRRIDLVRVHPVNREEVERLLGVADTLGASALSPRERQFLDTLTELSSAREAGGEGRSGEATPGSPTLGGPQPAVGPG